MPDPSVFTGIDPTNIENSQLESQERLAQASQQLPTSIPSSPNLPFPDVTKGQFGTVAPDQNVNIDKTSPEFSQNFYSNLLDKTQKQYPGTYDKLPDIDLPQSETKRYTSAPYGFDLNRNNESFYADRQGIPSMLANSLWNGVVKTGAYVAQNAGFVLGAPVAAVTQDITNMTDNFLTRLGDGMKNWVQTTNPIYKSDAYQNGNIFQKLGTLGWWTDDAMDRIALTLAMVIPGQLESKGIGLFGTAAVEGSDALRAVGPGAKAIESFASNPENYGTIGKTFLKGLYNAAANGEADLASSPLLRSYAQGLKRAEFYSWNLIGQSGLNAKETQDAIYQATGNKDKAADGAMKSFMETIPLALSSSLVELPQMFSSMNTAKSIMSKIYNRETGETLANALELQAPSIGKLMLKSIATGLEHGQNESAQVAVSRHNEEAAEAKDPSKVKSIFQDFLDNIHDPNGQNNIALGTIQGMLMTLGSRAVDIKKGTDAKELAERKNLFEEIEQAKLGFRSYNDDMNERDPQTGKVIVNSDGTPKKDQNQVALAAMGALKIDSNLQLKREAVEKGDTLSAAYIDFQTLKAVAYKFLQDPDGLQHLKNTLTLESGWAGKNPDRINDLDEYGHEITPETQLRNNIAYVEDLNKVKNAIDQRHAGFTNLDIDEKDPAEVQRRAQFIDSVKRVQYSSAADQLFFNRGIEKAKAEILSLGKGEEDKIISDVSDPLEEKHNELVKANEILSLGLEDAKATYKVAVNKTAQKEAFDKDKKRKEADKAFTADQDKKTEEAKKKAETPVPNVVTPEAEAAPVVTDPAEDKAQKLQALATERDKVTQDPNATAEQKQIANSKFLTDSKALGEKTQEPVVNHTPEQQNENFKKLSEQIPDNKSIHINDFENLSGDINQARKKGEIASEHEKSLFAKLQDKEIHGTILDADKEIKDTTPEKEQEDNTNKGEVDNNTDDTVLENPQTGDISKDYDPDTVNADDSVLDQLQDFFSAMANETPSKTVTQEEIQYGNGKYAGRLDEDEYKQFKQNFLRNLTPEALDNYSGKIIKDNDDLPHSEQTKSDIKKGTSYGSVLIITDKSGNIINFGPNYEETTEQREGYKPMVYSFNRHYWRLNQEQRALIKQERHGGNVDEWIKDYEQEADKQDLARQLNDKGKDVQVSLKGVAPGVIRSGKNLVDSNLTITKDMNPRLYIPPTPLSKWDPENPKKNMFTLVGNQALINGALYAHLDDPISKVSSYVRLIPKPIGEVPEMFEEVKTLFTHLYKDANEASVIRNYLSDVLFLDKSKRPRLVVDENAQGKGVLTIINNGVALSPEEAVQFIADTRYNITRNNQENPAEYATWKIEEGRPVPQVKEDYTKFVLENSQTRELPIRTSEGNRYIPLNTYLTFTFKDSYETMKAELTKDHLTPPGEHPTEKGASAVRAWRHGQATDDFEGKTSGRNDTPLTDKGREMAANIGEKMKAAGVKALVISPILRVRQTATIAASIAGIEDVKVDKDLATWNIGEYAGGLSSDFDEDYFIKNPDSKVGPDGKKVGETFNTYVKRMIRAYNMAKALPNDTDIISHSRNMRVWDAFSQNNQQWNDEAVQKYMNIPKEHSFTDIVRTKEEVKDNSSLTKKAFTRLPDKQKPTGSAEDIARRADEGDEENKSEAFSRRVEGEDRPIEQTEVDKVNKIFDRDVIERLDNIFHSDATAQFINGGIKLYRDAQQGDGYHEAWHMFSQMYLNDKEKRGLYDELRKRDLRFKSRDGRNLTTKKASDFDIEEFLADDFRDYAKSDGRGSRVVERPYRNNIFRKLLDFIKKFFFGEINPSKLYDELYRGDINKYNPSMNNAWWGKMNSQALNSKGDEIVSNDRAPYFRDFIDYLMGKQLLGLKTSTDAMRRSPDLTQAIYENIYHEIASKYYNPMLDKFDLGQDIDQTLAEDMFKVLSNWEDFVQYHKEESKLFLNIPHFIEQNVTDDPEDRSVDTALGGESYEIHDSEDDIIEDYKDDGEESLKPTWEHAGNELSSWDGASPESKALIRMLPKIELVNGKFQEVKDSNGIPKLNDYAKTWTNLSIALSNMPDYADMYEKLRDPSIQAKIPEVSELLNHLPDPYKVHNAREINQIIRFRKDFNKAYIGIFSGKMYMNGEFFFAEETLRNQDAVKKLWTANFLNKGQTDVNVKSGNILVDPETSRNYLNPAKPISLNMSVPADREKLNDLLGFKFSDETKKQSYYQRDLSQNLRDIQDNINKRLEQGQKIMNPIYDLRYDLKNGDKLLVPGLSGIIDAVTYLESRFTSEVPTLSYRTADGNMIHGLSSNHTMSIVTNGLNRATDYSDIKNTPYLMHLDYENNPNVKGSYFLNNLFNLKAKDPSKVGERLNNNLIIGNYNGLKFEDRNGNIVGFSTTSLNTGQKVIFDLNSLLTRGASEIPRTEASKSAYFMKLQRGEQDKQDPSKAYLPVGISEFSSGFSSPTFHGILINGYLKDELSRMKGADNVPIYKSDSELLKAAKTFSMFRDILREPKGDTEKLKNDLKAAIVSGTVDEAVQKYRARIETNIENYFNNRLNSFKRRLDQENIGPDRITPRLDRYNSDQKYRAFLANDFILKAEHIKLFQGDTIYEKHYGDYFKRSKGITGSGAIGMTDDAFGNYMKSNESRTFGHFIKSTVPNDYTEVNTKNLKEDKRDSAYIETYKKDLKAVGVKDEEIEDIVGKYKGMKVGDGQGYATMDFYRQHLKSIDNWTDKQELQYQVELAKWRLKHADFNEEYTGEQKAADRDFLKRNDGYHSNFNIVKDQYNGPMRAFGTYAPVMDKFAVSVLVPSAIEGTQLEALHHNMLKNGYGYVKYESATKKYKSPAVSIYNEDGSAKDIDLGKPDKHFLQYFKEQIHTSDDTKGENIWGSQIRKLIESGAYSNGFAEPIDVDRHERYKGIISKVQKIQEKKLFDEFGLSRDKEGKISISNMQKFVASLHEQADMRELNDELKNYIQYDKDTNKLKYPLETSLNRADIQKLIMGMIDRTMRRIKVNGDQMVQTSSSGWTSNDFNYTNRNEDNLKKYGTNGLGFYHIVYDDNGKPLRTEAARAKVPLNRGWENLTEKKHLDGNKIGTLDRLNELLRSNEWRSANKESLTFISYRIPTQGLNSMEFFEVEQFLPPHLGSTIVVPAEIVAKSGSDFDLDKLPTMRPSFDENGELIKDTETLEGNYNKNIALYREILEDPRHFKDLITPNSTDKVMPTIHDISVKLGRRSEREIKDKEPYTGTQVYDYMTSLKKGESLLSQSKLLGGVASQNSFIPVMQQEGITTSKRYVLNGVGRNVRQFLLSPEERKQVDKNGRLDFSNKNDVEGNSIQDIFSQLVNVTVDAPSDDSMGYTDISFENLGVMNYLMFQGVPYERVMWYLHQPALMRYYSDLRGKDLGDSVSNIRARLFSKFTGVDYFYTDENGNRKLDWKVLNKSVNEVLDDPKYKDIYIDLDNLKKTTKKISDVNSFVDNPKAKDWNKVIFANYIALKEQSQLFRDFQSNLRYDVTKMQSPISAYQTWKAQDQIKANQLFSLEDFDKMDNKSIISPLNNKILTAAIGSRLMLSAYNFEFMKRAAIMISKATEFKNAAFKRRFTSNYESQFVEYVVKSLGKIDGEDTQTYSKKLLEGKNNMVRRFNDLISKYPELKDNYSLVSRIRPNISNNPNVKKFNLEVQRLFDNNQDDQNRYAREFRSLINFNDKNYTPEQQLEIRKFFKDMAIMGFLQSGFNKSNISFQDIVPHEVFADMFKNAITNFNSLIASDKPLMQKFINEFNNQFGSNQRTLQSYRGRNYYLSSEISKAVQAKTNKLQEVKTELNTKPGIPEQAPKLLEENNDTDLGNIKDEDIYTPEEVERSQSGDIQFEEEQPTKQNQVSLELYLLREALKGNESSLSQKDITEETRKQRVNRNKELKDRINELEKEDTGFNQMISNFKTEKGWTPITKKIGDIIYYGAINEKGEGHIYNQIDAITGKETVPKNLSDEDYKKLLDDCK